MLLEVTLQSQEGSRRRGLAHGPFCVPCPLFCSLRRRAKLGSGLAWPFSGKGRALRCASRCALYSVSVSCKWQATSWLKSESCTMTIPFQTSAGLRFKTKQVTTNHQNLTVQQRPAEDSYLKMTYNLQIGSCSVSLLAAAAGPSTRGNLLHYPL